MYTCIFIHIYKYAYIYTHIYTYITVTQYCYILNAEQYYFYDFNHTPRGTNQNTKNLIRCPTKFLSTSCEI